MGRDGRGQTSLDFAAGMSAFLLVFAFTLTFVPGMLQPFTASGQEETVVADRVADQLVEGMLVVDTSDPYVLDVDCIMAFFGSTDNCGIDSSSRLEKKAGISTYDGSADTYRQRINVRIIGEGTDSDDKSNMLCNDGSGNINERDDTTCDTEFVIGSEPPTESGSVVVARRVVSIGEQDATLLVRVW